MFTAALTVAAIMVASTNTAQQRRSRRRLRLSVTMSGRYARIRADTLASQKAGWLPHPQPSRNRDRLHLPATRAPSSAVTSASASPAGTMAQKPSAPGVVSPALKPMQLVPPGARAP